MYNRQIPIEAFGEKPLLRIRNIDAVVHNYLLFRNLARATNSRCAPVLKGDVHGLGVGDVAPALYKEGAREFFVEEAVEGAVLRRHLASDGRIYVLAGFLEGEEQLYRDNALVPCVNSLMQLDRWRQASTGFPDAKAAVYFDCGMNRIGLNSEEVAHLGSNFDTLTGHVDIVLYMSHLFDIKGHDQENCYKQREILTAHLALLPRRKVSLACTDAVTLLPNVEFNYDMIRPGIGLVGGAPNAEHFVNGLKSTVEYYVKLSHPKSVCKGATVGYGGSFTLRRNTKVAIAHVGYKDGYVRSLSRIDAAPDRGGWMAIGGHKAPVIGKISLGLTALDVSDVPKEILHAYEYAEVLGPNVDLKMVADICGCYEFLVALGRPNPKMQDFTLNSYVRRFTNEAN
jgi:alanine racemase